MRVLLGFSRKFTQSKGRFGGTEDSGVQVPVGEERDPVAGAEVREPEGVGQVEGSAEQTSQGVIRRLSEKKKLN
jgi:hypothetical protein